MCWKRLQRFLQIIVYCIGKWLTHLVETYFLMGQSVVFVRWRVWMRWSRVVTWENSWWTLYYSCVLIYCFITRASSIRRIASAIRHFVLTIIIRISLSPATVAALLHLFSPFTAFPFIIRFRFIKTLLSVLLIAVLYSCQDWVLVSHLRF